MFTFLILAGAGALGYKLGVDANNMKRDGKNDGEILMSMPGLAVGHVSNAVGTVYGAARHWIMGDEKPKENTENKNESSKSPEENKLNT